MKIPQSLRWSHLCLKIHSDLLLPLWNHISLFPQSSPGSFTHRDLGSSALPEVPQSHNCPHWFIWEFQLFFNHLNLYLMDNFIHSFFFFFLQIVMKYPHAVDLGQRRDIFPHWNLQFSGRNKQRQVNKQNVYKIWLSCREETHRISCKDGQGESFWKGKLRSQAWGGSQPRVGKNMVYLKVYMAGIS